jgi:hypothetical protein
MSLMNSGRKTEMKNNHLSIEEIVKICGEHADLIRTEIAERREMAKGSKGFLSFDEISDIRGYRGARQYFAIGNALATGLAVIEDDDQNLWIPAIIDGKVFASYPDEGHGGIAHLCDLKTVDGRPKNKWIVIWIDGGWLHMNEFENLTPMEIGDVLIEEIKAGENVITKKPVGWV